jgi:hypothetical protein
MLDFHLRGCDGVVTDSDKVVDRGADGRHRFFQIRHCVSIFTLFVQDYQLGNLDS